MPKHCHHHGPQDETPPYPLAYSRSPLSASQEAILLDWKMNAFPAGTRVSYWNSAGQAVYGTVQRVYRTSDGTVVVDVKEDSGKSIALP
ncbi:hypothetical protein B0H13DRAFT_2385277 [Mycena leptocephala]|nr:hypothetical protein B0H13DRAFT_2385277 [Mycena leptocephala]